MSTMSSCRLTLFIAPEAGRAVILRRGPTRWVHLILWNMPSDEFEFGSWFEGRIYEDRCDLSPDGQFFLYFAANQSHRNWTELGADAWTAICQPPWVKAIVLYPSGCGTWGGGGQFVTTGDPMFADAQSEPLLPKSLRIAYGHYKRPHAPAVQEADSTGLDHKGQVVYSVGGKLWRCCSLHKGRQTLEQVADFTELAPPDVRRNWKPQSSLGDSL